MTLSNTWAEQPYSRVEQRGFAVNCRADGRFLPSVGTTRCLGRLRSWLNDCPNGQTASSIRIAAIRLIG